MKPFSDWSIEEVENEFGIGPKKQSDRLDSWVTVQSSLSEVERQLLEGIRSDLEIYGYSWNEQELIANCIAPLLRLVNFLQDAYRGFFVRKLATPYNNDTLSGEVDFMVAQGRHSPQRCFFFLYEYKREIEQKDPRGQLMVAMVAAQMLNQDENPIYGAYVVGPIWRFALLEGKEYIVHRGFNAASHEIEQILGILRNTRAIIEQIIEADNSAPTPTVD